MEWRESDKVKGTTSTCDGTLPNVYKFFRVTIKNVDRVTPWNEVFTKV